MAVLVVNDFAAAGGGGTAVARFCAAQLAERGVRVAFVAGDAPQGADAGAGLSGAPTIGLGLPDIRQQGALGALGGLYRRETVARLRAALAPWPAAETVVLLHQWTRVLTPAVFEALRGYRVLLFAHDYFLACPNGAYFNFPRRAVCSLKPMSLGCAASGCDRESLAHKAVRLLRHAAQDRALRDVDLTILCVSEGQRERFGALLGAGRWPVEVLENIPAEPPGARVEDLAADFDVAFVGRMVEEKGLDLLLAAARAVGARVGVFGDGPQRAILERAYPEARFFGWRPRAEVQRAIAGARATVAPSLWAETSALVALESLDVGTPVIVSDRICIAPWVVRSGLGLSVPPEDPARLQAALAHALSPAWLDGPRSAAQARARSLAPPARARAYVDRLLALAGPRAAA